MIAKEMSRTAIPIIMLPMAMELTTPEKEPFCVELILLEMK
jgi:hypothetical protein